MSETKARRIAHPARWIAGALVAVLIGVAIVAATRPAYQATAADSPLLGKPAPTFSETSFAGDKIALNQYRGRYVVVTFFSSWCAPCQQEEPNLVAFNFQQSKATDGAALVSVVFQDSDVDARQFVDTYGAQWPTVPDPGGAIANNYGVTSPPSTFLVDPHGRVVGDLIGPAQVWQLNSLLATARHSDA